MPLYILDNWASENLQELLGDLVKVNPGPFFTQPAAIRDMDDNALVEVTYDLVAGSTFAENFMSALCNSTINYNIELVGVTSSFVNPATHLPITSHGADIGFNLTASEWILVWIDMNNCNTQGYHGFAPDGSQIRMYPQAILAHELSHALHAATGSLPPNPADAERQAITDENSLRAQYQYPLRDANNHNGGCGYTGHEETFWDGVCFILTAPTAPPMPTPFFACGPYVTASCARPRSAGTCSPPYGTSTINIVQRSPRKCRRMRVYANPCFVFSCPHSWRLWNSPWTLAGKRRGLHDASRRPQMT